MATAGRKRGRKKKKKHKKTMMTKKITKLTKKFRATLQLRHQHCTKLIPHLIAAISSAHSFLLRHDLHLLPHQSLSLESLISSTSSSISNIVSLLSLPPPPPRAAAPPSRAADPLPGCWFQRFLIADSDTLWAETFNLTKPSFTLLLRLLTPSLSSLSVPPNYALALTLYRLAHAASFSAVSRRFGVDSPTACRVFYTVCKAINDNLGHLFELKSDINRVIVGFGWISLPNCCGVLGIEKFELDGDLLGENGFLIVQALVDSEGRFLDVSAGWPSTMKPETVLRKSSLYLGVEESKEYLNGSSFELNDGNSIPQYILGDSCFPLLPWVLTPYRGESSEEDGAEMAFNSVHRRGMQLVGTAFGRVREKWKLLARKWNAQCIEALPFVIVTCCLLHNFLIKCSEAVTDETEEYPRCEEFPVFDGEVDESGKKIRDALASHLLRNQEIVIGLITECRETEGQPASLLVPQPLQLPCVTLVHKASLSRPLFSLRNELQKEDLTYFNHEFLQSMGIIVAKHRLEILKLARKEGGGGVGGTNSSSNSLSRLVLAINKTKKLLAKNLSKLSFHRSSTHLALSELKPYRTQWTGALKKLENSKEEKAIVTTRSMIMKSGPLDRSPVATNRNLSASGPLDRRVLQEKLMYPNRSPMKSGPLNKRYKDSAVYPSRNNKSGPLDAKGYCSPRLNHHYNQEMIPVDDGVIYSQWSLMFQDMKPT